MPVWLVLKQDSQEFRTIVHFIKECASKYSSPSFTPHITFARIPDSTPADVLEQAVRNIANEIFPKCATVGLDGVRKGSTFFQSVFLAIDSSSSQRLLEMQRKFYKSIDVMHPRESPEFAHMGLFYGEDSTQKDEVATAAGNIGLTALTIGEVWITSCKGPVEDWKVLKTFPEVSPS